MTSQRHPQRTQPRPLARRELMDFQLLFKYDNTRFSYSSFCTMIDTVLDKVRVSQRMDGVQIVHTKLSRSSFSFYMTVFIEKTKMLRTVRLSNHYRQNRPFNTDSECVTSNYRNVNELVIPFISLLTDTESTQGTVILNNDRVQLFKRALDQLFNPEKPELGYDQLQFWPNQSNQHLTSKVDNQVINVSDQLPDVVAFYTICFNPQVIPFYFDPEQLGVYEVSESALTDLYTFIQTMVTNKKELQ